MSGPRRHRSAPAHKGTSAAAPLGWLRSIPLKISRSLTSIMFTGGSQRRQTSSSKSFENIFFRTYAEAPAAKAPPVAARPQPRPRPAPPPRPQPPTLHQVHMKTLGLTGKPDARALRSAYLRLAQQFHPDRFASAAHTDAERTAAGLKMGEINEAYAWLKRRL